MSSSSRTWGMWTPVPDEAAQLGEPYANPLEWWPSGRAAEAALRSRVPAAVGTANTDTMRRADGIVRTDAQFYGGPGSVIFLYEVEGEPGADPHPAPAPHAVLEFGPRGGIRRRALPAPAAG